MSMLDRMLARAGYSAVQRLAAKERKSIGGKTMNTTDPALVSFFNGSTYTGKTVNDDTAMRQSTVWTCTRIIAETIGSLPGGVFEVNGENSVKVEHDMAGLLFDSPNADMDGVEFTESVVTNLALAGNGYSLINWRGKPRRSPITSLFPMPASKVIPKRENDGTITYKYNDRGRWEEVPQEMMWHVKGFGSDGIMGYSPVGYQRQMIGMALATEEFQARFFANGAMPSWLISIPQWLTKDQRAIARENVDKLWGGAENAYKAQLLEGGMSAVSATMPLQDAQFLELREATKTDIFGMYRVPPHMGGELKRSTNNNIEQQALEFVMYCLLPYLTRLEKSVSKWLFMPEDRKRFRIRFNVEGLLRADAAARGMLYSQLLGNGVLTRNEVRALEGRNRSEEQGMDEFTVQSAMVPIDRIGKLADATAAPKPAAALPVPVKGAGDTQNFAIMLPDSMQHEVKQLVNVPGLDDLVAQVVKANANNEATAELVRERIKAMLELAERIRAGQTNLEDRFAAGIKELVGLASADRVLVEDERGFAVRSRLDTGSGTSH